MSYRRNWPFVQRQYTKKKIKERQHLSNSLCSTNHLRAQFPQEFQWCCNHFFLTSLPRRGCALPPCSTDPGEGQMEMDLGSVPATQRYIWTLPWHGAAVIQHQSRAKCLRTVFLMWLKKTPVWFLAVWGAQCHTQRQAVGGLRLQAVSLEAKR